MIRRWLLSQRLPSMLAVIGTALLIISWVRQNRELVRASEDVSRLQRSQLVIDTDEIARDQWLIALDQEMSKTKPSQELLAAEARGALEGFLRWQTHMEERVAESSDEYKNELAARDLILSQAEKLEQAGDYKTMMALLQRFTVMSHTLNSTAELDKHFFAKVDDANNKVAELEGQVRSLYVLGTAFLLLSSILASVFLDVTLRQVEKETLRLKSPPSSRRT